MKKNILIHFNKKIFSKKKILLLVVLIIGFMVLGYLLAVRFHNNVHKNISSSMNVTHVCTSKKAGTLLQQAQIPLFGTEQPQLYDIVQNIEKLPGYQRDPNCLYVITSYYVNASNTNISNLAKAKFYLAKLNQYYNPKVLLSPMLGPDIPGVLGLNQQVVQLETKK